jgi:hypothetical protein
MAEIDRPEDCEEDCACLGSFDDRLCLGMMSEPKKHRIGNLELANNVKLCLLPDDYESNAGDLYYIASLAILGIKHIIKNDLYNPCEELAIADPIRRLKEQLES